MTKTESSGGRKTGIRLSVIAALLGAGLAHAQQIEQGENAEALLDLDSISGDNPADRLGSLVGNIKTVCAGNLLARGQLIPNGASNRLQLDCNSLVTASLIDTDNPDVAEAIEQVANEEVASQGTLGVENSQLQARNVASRMIEVQTGVSAPRLTLADFGLANIAPRTFSVALGVNGDEAIGGFSRTSVFVNGSFYTGEQDPNRREKSFDWDSYAVTAGIDHRFTDNFFGGVSVGYTDTEGDFDVNGGEVESDNFTISVFGSYYTDGGFYIDGVVGTGSTDYETDRNIRYQVVTGNINLEEDVDLSELGFAPVPNTPVEAPNANVNQVARSSTDGDELSLSLGAGYHIQRGAATITPRVGINYLSTEVDGYDETMCSLDAGECRNHDQETGNNLDGAGWAVAVGEQNIESLRASLGIGWKTALNQNWGVFLPYANVDYVHEFKDNPRNVLFCFREDKLCSGSAGVATLANPFVIRTAAPDEDFFLLSGGFVAQFAGGKTAFVNLEHMAGNDDVEYTGITAGFRFEFN